LFVAGLGLLLPSGTPNQTVASNEFRFLCDCPSILKIRRSTPLSLAPSHTQKKTQPPLAEDADGIFSTDSLALSRSNFACSPNDALAGCLSLPYSVTLLSNAPQTRCRDCSDISLPFFPTITFPFMVGHVLRVITSSPPPFRAFQSTRLCLSPLLRQVSESAFSVDSTL